ncbi:MAG: response regulator transcription factor [Planctomycetes bacterium]|nr:response regulator transcription factor [Planctomycetota bacterium]
MKSHAITLVVDDDESCLATMCRMLESAGVEARAFHSIEALMTGFDAQEVGCILLDLTFPWSSGLALQEWLREKSPTTPVVYVSGSGSIPSAVQALKLGAVDFLEKPVGREKLVATVHKALEEGTRRREIQHQAAEVVSRFESFTAREAEIARMLLEGLSSKEIARLLHVSPRTIDHHRSAILRKMQASNVADLARKLTLAAIDLTKRDP